MQRGALRTDDLGSGAREIEEGRLAANRFDTWRRDRERMAPRDLLPRVKVPSFHYYGEREQSDLQGYQVKKVLTKQRVPFRYVSEPRSRVPRPSFESVSKENHEENVRSMSELLAFLEEYLPVSGQ